MQLFYANALSSPDVRAGLDRYNVTEDAPREGQSQAVLAARRQQREKARGTARVAVTDRPQLLEAIGIVVPS